MKTKRISRQFKTSELANEFYLDLCEQYDSVKLVHTPGLFTESGLYIWEVSE